jgi:protocatechuate 3,4-dioxygenase, alpha subunit
MSTRRLADYGDTTMIRLRGWKHHPPVFARGMLHRSVTRIYFADEVQANAGDPVLARVPVERRATLLAEPVDDGYQFDIRFQGPHETVFFAV